MCSNISSKCFHVKDSLGMKLKQLVLIFYLVRMCCQKKKTVQIKIIYHSVIKNKR